MSRVTDYIALAAIAAYELGRTLLWIGRAALVAALVPLCLPILALAWAGGSARAAVQPRREQSGLSSASRALALSDAMKKNPRASQVWFAERLAEV